MELEEEWADIITEKVATPIKVTSYTGFAERRSRRLRDCILVRR